MSNQHPAYNPGNFPFSFPFSPQFNNPMPPMPPGPRIPQNPFSNDFHLHHQMPMPPMYYPPFPFMPPHMGNGYYHFQNFKMNKMNHEMPRSEAYAKQRYFINSQNKVKKGLAQKSTETNVKPFIIVDDDQRNSFQLKKATPIYKGNKELKKNKKNNQQSVYIRQQIKDYLPAKIHKIYKKKQTTLEEKKKIQKQSIELRKLNPLMGEVMQESNGRTPRTRMLSAKDGKRKIMIGKQYQAEIPSFTTKHESFTVWVSQKKQNLISRYFQ